jgi:adenylate kinase family enzyme
VQRVVVIGQSGAGKTTLARRLARQLQVPHLELDAFFHGPDWQPTPTFVRDVDAATSAPAWVVDGNYSPVRDLVWSRADTVVWLDLPRTTTLRRVLLRTARRLVTRPELWNGNREPWRTVLRASHPIRWTWQTYHPHRHAYEERMGDPRWEHVTVTRLHTPAQVSRWLRDISGQGS